MPWLLKDRFINYTQSEALRFAIWGFFLAAKNALVEGRYHDLFRPQRLLDESVHWWFKTLKPHFLNHERGPASPLPQLIPQASGVVLEVGPGLGNQLFFFDKERVTHAFGVENSPHFIPDLQESIHEYGLEGVYEIVPAGIEESDVLESFGITAGSLDTVICTGVLCTVSNPTGVVKELHRLLKPGGRLIFWEHHRNSDRVTAAVQAFWNIFWSVFVGGCNLNRDIREILLGAAEWENLDSVVTDEKDKPASTMPRVWGILVKPATTS
ncbi:hypothetical protein OQA88_5816 [Cercophora sp. LCS_1]